MLDSYTLVAEANVWECRLSEAVLMVAVAVKAAPRRGGGRWS